MAVYKNTTIGINDAEQEQNKNKICSAYFHCNKIKYCSPHENPTQFNLTFQKASSVPKISLFCTNIAKRIERQD